MAPMLRTAAASIVALLALGVSSGAGGTTSPLVGQPAPEATLTQLAQDIGGRGASAADPGYRYLRKLDSHLQDIAASRLGGTPAAAAVAADRQGVTISSGDDVQVDVYVDGDVQQAARQLRALGMRVTATSERAPQRLVEGLLPSDQLAAAARLGSAHAIVSSVAGTGSGGTQSEGDAAVAAPAARLLGPNGAGISVGIISDSIDEVGGGVASSQASGDLPANVQVLLEPGDARDADEGRAMAEIVYDEAPGISGIAFSTGFIGAATKAASIDNLVSSGVKVIADDIFYEGEPFFQDDIIAEAVDRAKAAGVAYFALAGNEGDNGWQGAYAPVAASGHPGQSTEDFDPSGAVDTVQSIGTIPSGQEADVSLQWAEPWGHAASDFAIDVYGINGGVPTFAFTVDSDNLTSGLPLEYARILADGGSAVQVGIAIRRVAGSGTPLLKFIDYTNGAYPVTIEHPSPSGTIDIDAGSARGALTVAASRYSTPATPEGFSSRGPVTHLFDASGNPLLAPEVRLKPDLAGPDGVTTSVPHFTQFFGTSAATPGAAAIAALIRSAKPDMPVDEVYAIMTDPANSLDCSPSGYDRACGNGFGLADRAVSMALDPTGPTITPTVVPPSPDGANGWYQGPVAVTWDVADPQSPVVRLIGCDAASIGDASSTGLTCQATSAGGTTTAPLSIKRDASPPSVPVVRGIVAQTYAPVTLPAAGAIGCDAGDATSGVIGCTVSGYDAALGAHTLTATATNGAGLSSTSTLVYTVVAPVSPPPPPPKPKPPAAVSKLRSATSGSLGGLSRTGIVLTMQAASASTRVVARVVAQVPKASGTGTRRITLGSRTEQVGAGAVHLKLALSAKAKRQLRGFRRFTLRITISAGSPTSQSAELHVSIAVKR